MEVGDIIAFGKKRMSEDEPRLNCEFSREVFAKKPLMDVSKPFSSHCVPHNEEGDFSFIPNEILVTVFAFVMDDRTFSAITQINKRWNRLGEIAWYEASKNRGFLVDEEFWQTQGKEWRWIVQAKVRVFQVDESREGTGCFNFPVSLPDKQLQYEGDWHNSVRHGYGKEIFNDSVYKGQWAEGQKEGFGVLHAQSGGHYRGEWSKGKRNGDGSYVFPNGDKYEGQWKNDLKHGFGLYTFGKGKWEGDRYEGEWKDNTKCGKGIYMWKDGDRYEGGFEHDNFNGFGAYYFACGDKYIGEWKSDKRYGQGVYSYHHGGKFEGTFKEGKRNGPGVFTWKDGDSFHGNWCLGSRKGSGVFITADGTQIPQVWDEAADANYSVQEPPKYPL
jgi:hypothetical protein